jgi:hypothetical protein
MPLPGERAAFVRVVTLLETKGGILQIIYDLGLYILDETNLLLLMK